MAGFYIHIPFCRQACRYCDFYFTVSSHYQNQFTDRLLKELEMRASDHQETLFKTFYLGGGTPSLLASSNLMKIVNQVRRRYQFTDDPEMTIECNPDDLDGSKLLFFRELGFNRISIGVQSFREEDLKLLHRSHSAEQAGRAINEAASAGFDNITVDLIYGIPGQTVLGWKENISRLLEFPVNHISAYHLTFEQGTVFDHWRKKGRITPVPEDQSVEMYHLLREQLTGAGFEHYEISNFAKKGWRSIHNQLYWSGELYLGFGPSAHSYNGTSRTWNVASLKKYMDALMRGAAVCEKENLTEKERYHDYLITSLRTSEGADPEVMLERFGKPVRDYFLLKAGRFLSDGMLVEQDNRLVIDPDSWLVADHIIRELFFE